MRVTRLALVATALLMVGVPAAQAQTNPGDDEGRFYAGVAAGATFGSVNLKDGTANGSSGSFGVEVGAEIW